MVGVDDGEGEGEGGLGRVDGEEEGGGEVGLGCELSLECVVRAALLKPQASKLISPSNTPINNFISMRFLPNLSFPYSKTPRPSMFLTIEEKCHPIR